MQARDHLLALETRLHVASNDLAANLRTAYENGSPSVVDVILNAHGFSNLLNQVNYIKRAQHAGRADRQLHQGTRAPKSCARPRASTSSSSEIAA